MGFYGLLRRFYGVGWCMAWENQRGQGAHRARLVLSWAVVGCRGAGGHLVDVGSGGERERDGSAGAQEQGGDVCGRVRTCAGSITGERGEGKEKH